MPHPNPNLNPNPNPNPNPDPDPDPDPNQELPSLYAAADAFVLPSRGEGWGRPVMEAMAMGLPTIATNWSGTTAFLGEATGYP